MPGIGTAIGAGVGAVIGRRKMKKEEKEKKKEEQAEAEKAAEEAAEQERLAEEERVSQLGRAQLDVLPMFYFRSISYLHSRLARRLNMRDSMQKQKLENRKK